MIKPIHFPQAGGLLAATTVDTKTNESEDLQYHFYSDPGGKFVISCFEFSEEDIKSLIETKKLFVMLPFRNQPPLTLMVDSPFTPKTPTNGKENEAQESPRNNGKHYDGDNQSTPQ